MKNLVGALNMPKVASERSSDENLYERELVRRIRANDRSAAEELVDRTYGAVYSSIMKLCGDAELAADLTQETYRKAWQSFSSFKGNSKLYTWLYRIAYTTFLNVRRRPPVVRSVSPADLPDPPDPGELPDQRAIDELDQEWLRRAVLELPDKQRFVVTAHYWGDLSLPEIAGLEGVSAVAIRKRLATAHETLASRLEDQNE
ncbi:MAG: sigma-70 family RNA polymerase sigma factor [Acidobacteria bacterium]|nr:sigma-70 family RNA polymerase sigma factor [Acidobacteriota bacterium]